MGAPTELTDPAAAADRETVSVKTRRAESPAVAVDDTARSCNCGVTAMTRFLWDVRTCRRHTHTVPHIPLASIMDAVTRHTVRRPLPVIDTDRVSSDSTTTTDQSRYPITITLSVARAASCPLSRPRFTAGRTFHRPPGNHTPLSRRPRGDLPPPLPAVLPQSTSPRRPCGLRSDTGRRPGCGGGGGAGLSVPPPPVPPAARDGRHHSWLSLGGSRTTPTPPPSRR